MDRRAQREKTLEKITLKITIIGWDVEGFFHVSKTDFWTLVVYPFYFSVINSSDLAYNHKAMAINFRDNQI